jgi:hypothetical protein
VPQPLGDAPPLDADWVETAFRTGAPETRIDLTSAIGQDRRSRLFALGLR